MEFASLTKRAAAHFGVEDIDAIRRPPTAHGNGHRSLRRLHAARDRDEQAMGAPGAVMDRGAILKPIDHDAYETVTTLERLDHWIARAREIGTVCVDTETTSLDPMQAGFAACRWRWRPNEACYIPCGHVAADGLDLGGGRRDRAAAPKPICCAVEAAAGRRSASSRSARTSNMIL